MDKFEQNIKILNEEEYLKTYMKLIENRLKVIEEEKKLKIEAGKTYVMLRKGTDSRFSLCHITKIDSSSDRFFCHEPNDYYWENISKYDFQEVDISIKEFFENMPQKYWKE